MGKKRSWELLNLPILIRKHGGKLKHKFLHFKAARELRNHGVYSYNFIAGYEFSPVSSPDFTRKRVARYLYPLLLCAPCQRKVEDVHTVVIDSEHLKMVVVDQGDGESPELSRERREINEEGVVDGIDQRADEFIARFYREMRLQREVSHLQFTEMLNRGC